MSEALPSQIDIRKLAVKGAKFDAKFPVSRLNRLSGQLADDVGSVAVRLELSIDEQGLRRLVGDVFAEVHVACQRCLQVMSLEIHSTLDLAIVWSDEEARHLPKHIDPLIVGEELTDLEDVVEEELILSLPIVSYHNRDVCRVTGPLSFGDEIVEEGEPKENPFKVLEQLKSDK